MTAGLCQMCSAGAEFVGHLHVEQTGTLIPRLLCGPCARHSYLPVTPLVDPNPLVIAASPPTNQANPRCQGGDDAIMMDGSPCDGSAEYVAFAQPSSFPSSLACDVLILCRGCAAKSDPRRTVLFEIQPVPMSAILSEQART